MKNPIRVAIVGEDFGRITTNLDMKRSALIDMQELFFNRPHRRVQVLSLMLSTDNQTPTRRTSSTLPFLCKENFVALNERDQLTCNAATAVYGPFRLDSHYFFYKVLNVVLKHNQKKHFGLRPVW